MNLACVSTCIENVKVMLDDLVTEETLTQAQADLLLPIVVEGILKGNSVGSS